MRKNENVGDVKKSRAKSRVVQISIAVLLISIIFAIGFVNMGGKDTNWFGKVKDIMRASKETDSFGTWEYIVKSDNTIEITGFVPNPGMTQIIIPNTINLEEVTSIGANAFTNAKYLQCVSIPSSVTSIGDFAFFGCENLMGIGEDGYYGYYEQPNLENAVFSDNLTDIGDYAFYGCTSLNGLTIPNSVISIGDYAFSGCGVVSISGKTNNSLEDVETSLGGVGRIIATFNEYSYLEKDYPSPTTIYIRSQCTKHISKYW